MACSDSYAVKVEPCTASGDNAVSISSPHVIQYPRPPRNNSGKWVAFGSLVGAAIGRMANSGKLSEASDAEDKWKQINEKLASKGNTLMSYADTERTRAALLDNCLNKLHEKLCCFAITGYIPDYTGILTRVQADVQQITGQKIAEMCRMADRYHTGINADAQCELQRETIKALVGTVTKAREAERQFAWTTNYKMLSDTTRDLEQHRNGRAMSALTHDQAGGEFLAGSGKNYAFLADSLRKSAQLDGNAWATLGALVAAALTAFSGCALDDESDCCPEPATPP